MLFPSFWYKERQFKQRYLFFFMVLLRKMKIYFIEVNEFSSVQGFLSYTFIEKGPQGFQI